MVSPQPSNLGLVNGQVICWEGSLKGRQKAARTDKERPGVSGGQWLDEAAEARREFSAGHWVESCLLLFLSQLMGDVLPAVGGRKN